MITISLAVQHYQDSTTRDRARLLNLANGWRTVGDILNYVTMPLFYSGGSVYGTEITRQHWRNDPRNWARGLAI